MKTEISFCLNGSEVTLSVAAHKRLLDVLRDDLGLSGTKEGCGEGECGACTVIVDGRAVNACLFPAPEVDGKQVVTIEGLVGPGNELSVIQKAFAQGGAIQCGFCSPGMIMATKALLDENHDPTDEEIREALLGNLCRCTGYVQILEAVRLAAEKLEESR
jgi:aerobic-type carbon monoxide dehydrogenase small subunit (CoxS/CutS family)